MFTVSETWKTTYPGAAVGILIMHEVVNPQRHTALDGRKEELERDLRSCYAGYDRAGLKALRVLEAYSAYYRKFKKTYHVQLQLESVVFKGKSIPSVSALVEAMFTAELKNLLLTAGHDLAAIEKPVGVDVGEGSETYVRLNGQEQQLKPGDMMIADAEGVISSVLYGPDQRTRITAGTQQVLFTVYAPAGIGEEAVYAHLEDIRDNVLLVAPQAQTETVKVCGTD